MKKWKNKVYEAFMNLYMNVSKKIPKGEPERLAVNCWPCMQWTQVIPGPSYSPLSNAKHDPWAQARIKLKPQTKKNTERKNRQSKYRRLQILG